MSNLEKIGVMKPPVLVLAVLACLISLIIGLFIGGQESQSSVRTHLAARGRSQEIYEYIKSNVEDVRISLEDMKAKRGDLKSLEKSVEATELCVEDLRRALIFAPN